MNSLANRHGSQGAALNSLINVVDLLKTRPSIYPPHVCDLAVFGRFALTDVDMNT